MAEDRKQPVAPKPSRLRCFLFPSWEQRKRALLIEAWVFIIAAYVLFIFAYLWPTDFRNVSPTYVGAAWAAVMVRTFVFHFGLVLLPVTAVTLWGRNWRLFLATLPLLGVTLAPTLWEFRPRPTPVVEGESVTVMSVNLLMANKSTTSIIDEIQAVDPDVLLIQEYAWHWHKALQAALSSEYPYIEYVTQEDSFGAAIYARRPFEGKVEPYIPLGSAVQPQMRAVIRIADRPVAFYNIHLLPPWGLESTIEHRAQTADLLDALAEEPLPVVLGGDFNFTENSPHASALARLGLTDAHALGGWGRGTTWPVNSFFRWIPSIRLDHVYLSNSLTCIECQTGVGYGSDHRPVMARIGFVP